MSSAAPAGGPPGHPALSQYEMERLENMRRNGEVLASLGLAPLVPSAPPPDARPKLCVKRERAPMAPSRTSERLQELPRAHYDDDKAYRRMMAEHVQELRARREQRRRERVMASERGASEECEASDDSEASGDDDGGVIVAYEPADDDAWGSGLPDGHAVVVEESEGVELHLSRRSATGYRNVTFMRNSARRPYTVWAPRCINTMQGRKGETKICLGHYSTATAAALRYARYVGDPRTGIDFAAKQKSVAAVSACGVKLYVSPHASTGYEGVRRHVHRTKSGEQRVRYRAIAPMRNGTRLGTEIGYFDTAEQAAVAFARRVDGLDGSGVPPCTAIVPAAPAAPADDVSEWADDETVCAVCDSGESTLLDAMLLCDGEGCERGYHLRCLPYATDGIPEGEWLCPQCEPPPPRVKLRLGPPPGDAVTRGGLDEKSRAVAAAPSSTPPPATAPAPSASDGRAEWSGICCRIAGCVKNAGHVGKCKVGVIEEQDYEVEEIVESRHVSGVEEFLVKWAGWPLEDATWEVEETLAGCAAAMRTWRRQQEAAREQDVAARDGATRDGPPLRAQRRRRASDE